MSRIISLLQSPPKSVEILPVDSSLQNYPRRVLNSVFASVPVQPLAAPLDIVDVSLPALQLLAPSVTMLTKQAVMADASFINVFAGNQSIQKSSAGVLGWAHRYWGTQFGNYAGQLGDGAAALIAQGNEYEVNLKGSGPTPFSRGFDGRKVLRSSIREYLCSEAMAGLDIPTTRAGSLIVSKSDTVVRDVNYSGRPIREKCAVVSRIAKTFFRFGSFESNDVLDSETVKSSLRYCWKNLIAPLATDSSFIEIVTDRTAYTVAKWQSVGFIHGVMNTDNMSIVADTIDYGPFGFMESFDPHFVPNTSDKFGKYAFSEQPGVAAWNCKRLQEVLISQLETLPPDIKFKEFGVGAEIDVEALFKQRFEKYYQNCMREKLGMVDQAKPADNEFDKILKDLLEIFDFTAVDYTAAFRAISNLTNENIMETVNLIMETYPSADRIVTLTSLGLKITRQELIEIEEFSQTRLGDLERAGIDLATLKRWRHKLDRIDRFKSSTDQELRKTASDMWSSWLTGLADFLTENSRTRMKEVNPIYIPRQHLLQAAITKAQGGDYEEVRRLREIWSMPFTRVEDKHYYEVPDLNDYGVCLSCSS